MILTYILAELEYVLICQVKEKKCNFENAFVEKSGSSKRYKINAAVEGLYLFSIQMFTFTDLSRYVNKVSHYLAKFGYHRHSGRDVFSLSRDLDVMISQAPA